MSACIISRADSPSERWAENIIARTILVEAGGEGEQGMYAVACVIQQRSTAKNILPEIVCLEPQQFTCWNRATTEDKKLKDLSRDTRFTLEQKRYASFLARKIISGEELDRGVIGYANHYHRVDTLPYWARGQTPVVQVGIHLFYIL